MLHFWQKNPHLPSAVPSLPPQELPPPPQQVRGMVGGVAV